MNPSRLCRSSNKLRQLELEEKREIHRIMLKLTALVHEHLEEIVLSLEIMAEFDELYARARLALRWECSAPELNDSGVIRLWRAKHPLLLERVRERKMQSVVPLTIEVVPPSAVSLSPARTLAVKPLP
ncbi:MAG: hypothetical protein IPP40_08400 [bacterium]|nr:hypothetical protein [bacterium]